jgi:hypothetical protein
LLVELNTVDTMLHFDPVAAAVKSKTDTFQPTVNAISELVFKHAGRPLKESERIMLKIVLAKDLPTSPEQQTFRALHQALMQRQRRRRTKIDLSFLIDVISNYI